jgi:hypothetical protein
LRILIMKGQSQYGGTRLFADHAAAAFRRRGHAVDVLDLTLTETIEQSVLPHAQNASVDLVFTINVAGDFRDSQGRTVTDIYGAPHVVWHTDYILNQTERLHGTPKSTAALVVDPTQVETVQSIFGADRFDHVSFFPHGAVGEAARDDAEVDDFVARRPIGVLWSGGFQQPDVPWQDITGPARQVMIDALDLALAVEWMPSHQALDTVLTSRGLDIRDPIHRGVRAAAVLVDTEVRKTRRFEFLKALAASGMPVHICGANWESELYRFRNATYEGEVEMTRMVELMRQSRVVLNTNANFGAGSHERPFSASLAGAACFSDFSRHYAQVFEPGKNIELFFWKDLVDGMERLGALAADPERCFGYARSAKALTLAGHTWDHRIDLILEAADAVKAPA